MAEEELEEEPVRSKELAEREEADFFHTILENFQQHRDKQVFGWLSEECKVIRSYTYGELDSRTQELASGLLNTIQEKECPSKAVVLCYAHGPEFIVAFLGCLRAGLIPSEKRIHSLCFNCDVNWSRMQQCVAPVYKNLALCSVILAWH